MTNHRKPLPVALLSAVALLTTMMTVAPAVAAATSRSTATSTTAGAVSAGTTSPSVTATAVTDDYAPILPAPRTDPFYTPPAG